jgi:competence ComEA-like helix-hairpin-helix protein
MHEAETRALWRAVGVLVVVSAVRWGWSSLGSAPTPPADSVLPELLDASEDAEQDGERRATPLAADEKIDPNRASDVELDRLSGVGPATARAIVAAREAGAVFRAPEDLEAVPGIGPTTVERIRSKLAFDDVPPRSARAAAGAARVNLNHADSAALETLPGVGPALAKRILAARKERMFTSVDDLERVQGIGPATIERLRSEATVSP